MNSGPMPNLRRIAAALQRESPLVLSRELWWRGTAPVRRSLGRRALQKACRVRYEPAAYYDPALDLVDADQRRALIALSNRVCEGFLPTLSYGDVDARIANPWNRDPVSGKDWPNIPSDAVRIVRHDGSDVKAPWELSRLQVLPVLGKTYRLTRDDTYRRRAMALITEWSTSNPVGVGVNWTIAMEAAMRAVSICLCLELLSPFNDAEQEWVRETAQLLWRHLLFIEAHSEFSHISRSNHYLSNVMGIAVLSSVLSGPRTLRRQQNALRWLECEMREQVYDDGGNWEASTGYQLEVAQMFTVATRFLRQRGHAFSVEYERRLSRMYELLAALASPDGHVPAIGDCDDGRVEWLSDDIQQLLEPDISKRDGLRIASFIGSGAAMFGTPWGGSNQDSLWIGYRTNSAPVMTQSRTQVFPDSGVAVAHVPPADVTFLSMPNGMGGRGSHHHNDKLQVLLRLDGYELFCDPGTGGYTRDVSVRNGFRRTAAHNTAMLGGLEQNEIDPAPRACFSIGNQAEVSAIETTVDGSAISLVSRHLGYSRVGAMHERTVTLNSGGMVIADAFGEAPMEFEVSFIVPPPWSAHVLASEGRTVTCRIDGPRTVGLSASCTGPMQLRVAPTEVSRIFGVRTAATRIALSGRDRAVRTAVEWQVANG